MLISDTRVCSALALVRTMKLFRPITKKRYIDDAFEHMDESRVYRAKLVAWARNWLRQEANVSDQ